MINSDSRLFIMTEPDTRKIFELYELMESKLQQLGIDFDEFSVLYKTFRNPPQPTRTELKKPNPFPWVSHAGAGWS